MLLVWARKYPIHCTLLSCFLTESHPILKFLDKACAWQASVYGETIFLPFFAFTIGFWDPTPWRAVGQTLRHWGAASWYLRRAVVPWLLGDRGPGKLCASLPHSPLGSALGLSHKCPHLCFHLCGYSFDQITLLDLFLVIWLSDMWFANISFCSVDCLCAFWMVSFAQSFSFWWNPVFLIFFFFCCLYFCHTQRWWSLIYPLVGYGYYSYYLVCLKSCMHLINMSPIWGCSDPLNHSFVSYHVIAVYTLEITPSFHHFRNLQGSFLNLVESEWMCWKCWINSKTCSS